KINPNYGSLDEYNRPVGIRATITPEMIGKGTRANQGIKPPGFISGRVGHARGHLLGKQLGGSGDEETNLVTLYQNPVNTPTMYVFENEVRNAVESGEIVEYSAVPVYKEGENIPIAITIEARGNNGFYRYVSILNKPKE